MSFNCFNFNLNCKYSLYFKVHRGVQHIGCVSDQIAQRFQIVILDEILDVNILREPHHAVADTSGGVLQSTKLF